MALNKLKALKLIQFLNKSIKKPETSLKYRNQFTLLTSVVLSAQCTDTNVNNVTKDIYKKYYTPKHFADLGITKIKGMFYLNKKGNLQNNKINFFITRKGKTIGKHSVIYDNKIENIELKHTAFSRELFADGALNAAIWISKKNKGLFNMQDMFGLK